MRTAREYPASVSQGVRVEILVRICYSFVLHNLDIELSILQLIASVLYAHVW